MLITLSTTGNLAKDMLDSQAGIETCECYKKKVIGKPCEGELHARFDEGEQETGRLPATAPALYSTVKKILKTELRKIYKYGKSQKKDEVGWK